MTFQDWAFFGVLTLIISAVVFYLLTRWAHSIGKQLKNQDAQIYLLKKILEKQGGSKDEIEIAEGLRR